MRKTKAKKAPKKAPKKNGTAPKKNGEAMTNGDVVRFCNGLHAVGELSGPIKYAHAVVRNTRKSLAYSKDLGESFKPAPEFLEFNELREKLLEKHSKKDDTGAAIKVPGQRPGETEYVIANQKAFKTAIDKLRKVKKHAKAIEIQEAKSAEYNALLEEPSDFEPYTIPITQLPKEMKPAQLDAIRELVE